MEYRKLIRFGNSSHIVTLPEDWLKKNKLNKGDLVSIEENGDSELILFPEKKDRTFEEKEIVIDITSKNERELNREIVSAYINNYKTIKIVGKDIEKNSKEIRQQIKDLTGLEILEQTKDYILARDMINMKDILLLHLIRRIDVITRNMLLDSKETLNKDVYQSLMQRDEDINRLAFLTFRAARFFIENPGFSSKNNLSVINIAKLWQISDHLERFADETKRVSRYLLKLGNNKIVVKNVQIIFAEIESCYIKVMKAFYSNDKKLALDVAEATKEVIDTCTEFSIKSKEREAFILMERFIIMINHVRTISQLTYI